MKRFTLILVAILAGMFTWAQNPLARSASPMRSQLKTHKTVRSATQTADPLSAYQLQLPAKQTKAKAPRRADVVTPPEGEVVYYKYTGTAVTGESSSDFNRTVKVVFSGNDVYVASLSYYAKGAWVKGTIDGSTVTFAAGQYLGDDLGVDIYFVGYDGSDLTDVTGTYDAETGNMTFSTFIIDNSLTDDISYYAYVESGATLTKIEGDVELPIEAPDGLEVAEFHMDGLSHDYDTNDNITTAPLSLNVKGGFVQTSSTTLDVYVQGLCTYLPEAWVKGTGTLTLDGAQIVFPAGQFYGTYRDSYDFYFVGLTDADEENAEIQDVVFNLDIQTMTLTLAEGTYVAVNGKKDEPYWYNLWSDLVIKPVVDKAAMPANPEITAMEEDGEFGYVVSYDVPAIDTDGEGLLSDKLFFKLYAETNGEVEALTFTPATHTKLTEEMTEVPVTFSDNYDFEDGYLYLNDLYSADWNKIGIQSIYYGGEERNATEIQWYDLKSTPSGESVTATFDFNEFDVPVSSGTGATYDAAGEITEDYVVTEEDVTLTISPADEGATPTRWWKTNNGPQLRCYSNTLTFSVPEGMTISSIVFNYNGKYWGGNNNAGNVSADSGEISDDSENKAATWTGKAQEVVFTIGANTQINSIDVAYEAGGEGFVDPEGTTYTFDNGTMQGWTTIDADGDGNDWKLNQSDRISTYNSSEGSVYSESYDNSNKKALTPDNYLVSPKMKLDGSITFFACAQDASYPAEHFGVVVSTDSNTDPKDFEVVKEWTLTATRVKAPAKFAQARSPRKAAGAWYQYNVDLSSYEGAEGYVAIRHFNCTDKFYIVVDDITLSSSWIEKPDYEITPVEGTVKSLSEFEIVFNNYDITVDTNAGATLTNHTSGHSQTATVQQDENSLSISFTETTEPGEYTLSISGVESEGEPLTLSFSYFIPEPPKVVELPEGAEPETWYFSASSYNDGDIKGREVAVAFYGNDIYVQGLCSVLPEAWVKGTLDAEAGTATFATGQYFGYSSDEEVESDLFLVGYDTEAQSLTDIVFYYDADAGTLTTEHLILLNAETGEIAFYDYISGATISRYAPEPAIEVPEGLETEEYSFKATSTEYSYSGDTKVNDSYSTQVQVGFDGDDLYIIGICTLNPELAVKATKNAAGKYVIPAGQYMGDYTITLMENTYTTGYYFAAVDEDGKLVDAVLDYDAENATFTSSQTLVLNVAKAQFKPDMTYNNVVITKIPDTAATPADPSVVDIDFEAEYPYVQFDIPLVDVEGNDILASKLFYTVWVVTNEDPEVFVLSADDYENIENDMTEVPYTFDDDWDIYAGGKQFYVNPTSAVATWKKVGVQSIYYGGGECHKSNVVWYDESGYDGISNVNVGNSNAAIYDMQGRRVKNPTRGIFITNGKKVLVK